MPTLRPRKQTVKNEEPETESPPLSQSPPPARKSRAKTDKKPAASGRKSISKKEPDVITIDETNDDDVEIEVVKTNQVKKENLDDEVTACEDEVYYDLSEKELKEINNAFDMNCSEDGSELLGSDDLKTAIRSLGYEPRADEIRKLLKKYSNKAGKINRDGFQKIMAAKIATSPGTKDNMNDAISKVFNLLDLNKTGFITLENLRSISKELNEEITDEELNEMMTEADEDGDFKISKDEFCNIMKKTSLY